MACLGSWGPTWGVLGVSRLHYTLATGHIASKLAAGEYARTVFDDRWQRILSECVRIRRSGRGRSFYRSSFARRAQALSFVDMVIEDARRLSCY